MNEEELKTGTFTIEEEAVTKTTATNTCAAPSTSSARQKMTVEKELHIAPMLDYSKREFRKLFSIMSTKVSLWTDMIVDETIVHSDKLDDIIEGDQLGNPQIFQIGSNDPDLCGKATDIILSLVRGEKNPIYSEINLNMDCPSPLVSGERSFGASLMLQAKVAYDVMESIQKQIRKQQQQFPNFDVKASIKCRIAVDDEDEALIEDLIEYLKPVCSRFILHARKCVLCGLMSPRQNRSVPPLNYPRVYQLCHQFPDCEFWINGGIRTLEEASAICCNGDGDVVCDKENVAINKASTQDQHHEIPCPICNHPNGSCTAPPSSSACCLQLQNGTTEQSPLYSVSSSVCGSSGAVPTNLLGCMMGRAAMDHPALFGDADRMFFGLPKNPCRNRREVLNEYCKYLERLYPRRCCDTSEEITYKLPVPNIERFQEYCSTCSDTYATKNKEVEDGCSSSAFSSATKVKIAPRIVGRSLKPVRGMFYGLPKSKQFIKACDKFGQNKSIRNCGPGFILRKAMQVMPDELLDQPFVALP